MTIAKQKLIDMYRVMCRIRIFEERLAKEYAAGKVAGACHLSSGQEAVATGACASLRADDYMTSTHRGHGHLIAKGARTDRMMAELYGKKTGYCKAKGGSMHIADLDIGVLGACGIVGSGIPIAGGAALSAKMKGTDKVTLCFLGDGATNTSRFHEGVNLASILKLPVVYVIENNQYAESTSISYAMNIPNASDRASAYGIPGTTVDGNDVVAVYEAVSQAVARARTGEGPTLIECKTCRWHGHYQGDSQAYRTKEEIDECRKRDPIKRFRHELVKMAVLTEQQADKIHQEMDKEIGDAVRFAEESPLPAPEEALEDVFVEVVGTSAEEGLPHGKEMKEITFLRAITEAVDEEMTRDPSVFIIGEDVRVWGAPRTEFQGLFDKYGPERVVDTPISETAILGGAIGAAAAGMRPIASLMYTSFLGCCGDELINQLQMRYMFGGKIKLPLTITCYYGAGYSMAAQHSKSLHGLLMAVPGLKIVIPSTPYEVKGLLKSAIRDDNPTIFLYHQMLIRKAVDKIPVGEYTIPLGKADVKREGTDITVVATGLMVHRALAAAAQLQGKGISLEIIDPRTLVPLDKKAIIDSIRKTGRLVLMEEEPRNGTALSRIAAMVAEEAFDYLDAPIKMVCAPDTPVPFSQVMEKFWMPDEEKLIKAINEIM